MKVYNKSIKLQLFVRALALAGTSGLTKASQTTTRWLSGKHHVDYLLLTICSTGWWACTVHALLPSWMSLTSYFDVTKNYLSDTQLPCTFCSARGTLNEQQTASAGSVRYMLRLLFVWLSYL